MIEIKCTKPVELTEKIKEYLKEPKYGFSVDKDGDIQYYDTCYEQGTYDRMVETPTDFSYAMWFDSLVIDDETLVYKIILNSQRKLTKGCYSFYHTTFARILLDNFDEYIESIIISAQLNGYDIIDTRQKSSV